MIDRGGDVNDDPVQDDGMNETEQPVHNDGIDEEYDDQNDDAVKGDGYADGEYRRDGNDNYDREEVADAQSGNGNGDTQVDAEEDLGSEKAAK